MRRRASGMAKSDRDGMLVVAFSVALLALTLLNTVPAEAQTDGTDLSGETAEITESATDDDEIVDRIVVAVGSCRVDSDASVVVEDDDRTRVRLTSGGNATITADADAVTIAGTGEGGNLEGINASGGDGQFGIEGETVVGEIVSSTGIRCEEDNPDTGPDDDQYNDPGDVDDPDDVVPGTPDDKPLPNTGGAPLIFGAAALALAAVLLARRILAP